MVPAGTETSAYERISNCIEGATLNRVFFALKGAEAQAERLCGSRDRVGVITSRWFPDGETWLRVEDDVRDCEVVVVARLDRPDRNTLPLLYAARTLRELGARKLTLVAPYLPYLRQDSAFHPGESRSARWYAELLSAYWDELHTVDPHLHRLGTLDDIFAIPTTIASSARPIARWLQQNTHDEVLLVGPDDESRQWVEPIAERLGWRATILQKIRHGDHEVSIEVPAEAHGFGGEAILVDDIISTGGTLLAARAALAAHGLQASRVIGVHGVFAAGALQRLREGGFVEVITTNSLPHETNGIDVLNELARGLAQKSEDDESGVGA